MVTCIDLSKHTRPGRLGFNYAIEFNMAINFKLKDWHKDYNTRSDSLLKLTKDLKERMGKNFQTHWSRNQKNRRWYFYGINNGRKIRICFRSERDRTLAMMMIS